MKWAFEPAIAGFARIRRQWDELNEAAGNHALLDSGFVDCPLRYFGEGKVLLGERGDPQKPGFILVVKQRGGIWETFQPSQAPLGLILLSAMEDPRSELRHVVYSLPGHAQLLSVLHQDPEYSAIPVTLEAEEFERVEYIETGCITLTGTFEEYWKHRRKKFRQNIERRHRRMEEQGHSPQLVALRAEADVAEAIREYGRIESKGWKARAGTAVSAENVQGRFYRELLERFCARGEGVIYQLRVKDQVVASNLCLIRNRVLISLKTAFDEEWVRYSPSTLMRAEIVKQLYADGGMRKFEFYGRALGWHRQWTEEIRTMYHVTCFRHAWVRTLRKYAKQYQSMRALEPNRSSPRRARGSTFLISAVSAIFRDFFS